MIEIVSIKNHEVRYFRRMMTLRMHSSVGQKDERVMRWQRKAMQKRDAVKVKSANRTLELLCTAARTGLL